MWKFTTTTVTNGIKLIATDRVLVLIYLYTLFANTAILLNFETAFYLRDVMNKKWSCRNIEKLRVADELNMYILYLKRSVFIHIYLKLSIQIKVSLFDFCYQEQKKQIVLYIYLWRHTHHSCFMSSFSLLISLFLAWRAFWTHWLLNIIKVKPDPSVPAFHI